MTYPHTGSYRGSDLKINIFADRKFLISRLESYLVFSALAARRTPSVEIALYLSVQKPVIIPKGPGVISFSHTCSIDVEKRAIRIWGAQDSQDQSTFDHNEMLIRPLACLLNLLGYYSVHGSLVQRNKTCLICAGPGGTGKSTLGCVLSLSGFTLLCDDMMFIHKDRGGCHIIPLRTHVKIDNSERKDFIDIKKINLGEVAPSSGIKKLVFIFPRYHSNTKPTLRPILRKDGVMRLISDNLVLETGHSDKRAGQIGLLDFICGLGNRAPFFELTYNDKNLRDVAGMIQELCV